MNIEINSLMAPTFEPVMFDILDGGHREYWLKGGRSSTKSSFISLMIVLGLLQNRNANAIIYRRVGNTVKDSVYAQMIWAIDVLGCAGLFLYRKSPYEIICKRTGQRIMFRGADDPVKSKSIKLTQGYFKYLWFEEATEFRGMEDIRSVMQSIFRGVKQGFTFYSYNPPRTASNWVNEEILKPVAGRLVHHSTYLDVPVEWLGDEFINLAEAVKATNERAYRNEYMGEVTGTGGNVFENLELREITDEEIGTFGTFYQGIDWGYFPDPFQWVRMSFNPAKRELYIVDEYRTVKTGNREAYDAIKDKLRDDETLIADSAEKKSIADFKEYGAWWIHGAVKGAGSVAYSMKWLAALGKIVIDPKRTPECAKEFRQYEYEQTADGRYVQGYPDRNNHAIDGVRYATSLIWRRKGE